MADATHRMEYDPFVIAVAGGTASGKTTVCDLIMQRLHDQCVAILAQDSFYKVLSPAERELAAQGGVPWPADCRFCTKRSSMLHSHQFVSLGYECVQAFGMHMTSAYGYSRYTPVQRLHQHVQSIWKLHIHSNSV